ncbi:hypothetical protein A3Q56_06154, partial [Intoshia linei]
MCDVLKKSSKKEIWNWQMQQTLEIAKPMVSRKFAKKLYKLIGVAFEAKAVSKGVKDVQKSIRKKKQGVFVFLYQFFFQFPLQIYTTWYLFMPNPNRSLLNNVLRAINDEEDIIENAEMNEVESETEFSGP